MKRCIRLSQGPISVVGHDLDSKRGLAYALAMRALCEISRELGHDAEIHCADLAARTDPNT